MGCSVSSELSFYQIERLGNVGALSIELNLEQHPNETKVCNTPKQRS